MVTADDVLLDEAKQRNDYARSGSAIFVSVFVLVVGASFVAALHPLDALLAGQTWTPVGKAVCVTIALLFCLLNVLAFWASRFLNTYLSESSERVRLIADEFHKQFARSDLRSAFPYDLIRRVIHFGQIYVVLIAIGWVILGGVILAA